MNKRQITRLIAAALVFVLVCGSGMVIRSFAGQQENNYFDKLLKASEDVSKDFPTSPLVGVASVEGTIQASSSTPSLFPMEGYDHNRALKLIDSLGADLNNKGILLYVNSPGGSIYESDELYQRLLKYKENTERPVWTYMANMAASDEYYISIASDKIIADSRTWTSLIGAIISLTNYKELMDKIGIKSVLFTSGRNKAMSSFTDIITEEQEQIFQSLVDESYNIFVSTVVKSHHMDEAKVRELADGRIYTARQARENKLIDQVIGYEDTRTELEEALGDSVEFYTPTYFTSLFASLFATVKDYTRSDVDKLADLMEIKGSGVPIYYAAIGE